MPYFDILWEIWTFKIFGMPYFDICVTGLVRNMEIWNCLKCPILKCKDHRGNYMCNRLGEKCGNFKFFEVPYICPHSHAHIHPHMTTHAHICLHMPIRGFQNATTFEIGMTHQLFWFSDTPWLQKCNFFGPDPAGSIAATPLKFKARNAQMLLHKKRSKMVFPITSDL